MGDYSALLELDAKLTPRQARQPIRYNALENLRERAWDQGASNAARPGDDLSSHLFTQFISEPIENITRGIHRSAYSYVVAADNIIDHVAESWQLDYDQKNNLVESFKNKLSNMPLDSTSKDWEDQLFYLIGQTIPDVAMVFMGGGVLGATVRYGAKAMKLNQGAATAATIIGRIAGDTAINVGTFMAYEAGQAELDKRDPDYASAAMTGLAMGALMSTTGRLNKMLGVSRLTSGIVTGGVLGGVTALYDDDPDTIAAHAILGGMFGVGVSSGKTGAGDLVKYVKARREAGLTPYDLRAFLQEFYPSKHDRIYADDIASIVHKNTDNVLDPAHMSPMDNFMMHVQQVSGKDIYAYNDNTIADILAREILEMQPYNGVDVAGMGSRSDNVVIAKRIVDSYRKANDDWLEKHPDYETFMGHKVHGSDPSKLWTERAKERKKGIKALPGAKILTDAGEPFTGPVAKDLSTKSELRLHELSLPEAIKVFGSSEPGWNAKVSALHKKAIDTAGRTFTDDKVTWPSMQGLIDHGLLGTYGHIHAQQKYRDIHAKAEPQDAKEILANVHSTRIDQAKSANRIEQKTAEGFVDSIYKYFVDSPGRLYNFLEGLGPRGIRIRNAHQNRKYMTRERTSRDIESIDRSTGMHDWSSDYREIVNTYYMLKTVLDAAQHKGAYPPLMQEIPKQFRPRSTDPALGDSTVHIHNTLRGLENEAMKYGRGKFNDGAERLKHDVEVVQSEFARVFKMYRDEGLIQESTYQNLHDLAYMPMKSLKLLEKSLTDRARDTGAHDLFNVTGKILDRLKTKVADDLVTDVEYLLKTHLAVANTRVASNRMMREISKVADEIPESGMFYKEEPGKHKDFKQYRYYEDGKEQHVWVAGHLAPMLDSSLPIKDGKWQSFIRTLSGVSPIRLSAVATNPVWAFSTHPLDVMHIFTHHQVLSKFVPTLVSKHYVYNKERGALPWTRNVISAFRKDKTYQKYRDEGGTDVTLISSLSNASMLKRTKEFLPESGKVLEDLGVSQVSREGYSGKYNEFIEFFGKIGQALEIGTRMTEVDMLMDTGKFATRTDAAHESLRRLNYARRGAGMPMIEQLIPFANSSAQILASNLSEVKTKSGVMRTATIMGQLAVADAMLRWYIEDPEYGTSPGIMKEIDWETRNRYWIIPVPGWHTVNPVTNELQKGYFKIKKAYNPIFTLLDFMVQVSLDRYWYGTPNIDPVTFENIYNSLAVASPIEFRNNVPPLADALAIAMTGVSIKNMNSVYRGPEVLAADQINTEITGGSPTSNVAIAIGQALNVSPAKTQAVADTYWARNPITWFLDLPFKSDPIIEQTLLDKTLTTVGTRQFIGKTHKRWGEAELGRPYVEKGGSRRLANVDDKLHSATLRFFAGKITSKQFITEGLAVARDTDNLKFRSEIVTKIKAEVRARNAWQKLVKRFGQYAVHDNLPSLHFWHVLSRIPTPEERAEYFYQELMSTPEEWRPHLEKLGLIRGIREPHTFRAYKKLKRKGDRL